MSKTIYYPIGSTFTFHQHYHSRSEANEEFYPLALYKYNGQKSPNRYKFIVKIFHKDDSDKDIEFDFLLWEKRFEEMINDKLMTLREIPMNNNLKIDIRNYKLDKKILDDIFKTKNVCSYLQSKVMTYLGYMSHVKNKF